MHFTENRKDYWDRIYTGNKDRNDRGDYWLEAHRDILFSPSHILDMGCGTGVSTEYLASHGHTVVATDISGVALARLRARVPGVETKVLDFSLGLPWKDETFDDVVADLCLHYFDIDTTMRLVKDILRVLKNGGYLLARVNSVRDTAHGFGKGALVQPNYFVSDGHYKRFFDRKSIEEIFRPFELVRVVEGCIETAHGRKHLYEVIGKKGD